MKVYLDDERPTPNGWVRTFTPEQTIEHLKTGQVEMLSLDHDLGDDDGIGTGYDVILWIEEQVVCSDFIPPEIRVHSANSSAKGKMMLGVYSIRKLYATK